MYVAFYSIMLHLVDQTLMWHGVKRLGKVQYQLVPSYLVILQLSRWY
jgi:hypothetical protein